jgi:hypothetical protein
MTRGCAVYWVGNNRPIDHNELAEWMLTGTYKGPMGGEIFIFADWYKKFSHFLYGQHRNIKIYTEP